MGKFLEFHRLFKTTRFLPEKTLPSGEVGSLEQSMFQNTFNSSQGLDDISSIVIKVPEFSVVTLVSPPERVVFDNVILFEILSDSPSFVISQSKSVLLEKSVDSRNTVVPALFKVVKSQSSVLGLGLLSL